MSFSLSLKQFLSTYIYIVINKCNMGVNQSFMPMIQFNLSGNSSSKDIEKWGTLAQSLSHAFSNSNFGQGQKPTIQFNISDKT